MDERDERDEPGALTPGAWGTPPPVEPPVERPGAPAGPPAAAPSPWSRPPVAPLDDEPVGERFAVPQPVPHQPVPQAPATAGPGPTTSGPARRPLPGGVPWADGPPDVPAGAGGPAGAGAAGVPDAAPSPALAAALAPPREAPDLPQLSGSPRRPAGQLRGSVAGRRRAARALGALACLALVPLVVLSCVLSAVGTPERAGAVAERVATTRALREAVAPQITDTVLAVTGEAQRDVVRPLVEQVLAEQGARAVARGAGAAAWQVTLGGRPSASVDLTPVTAQVWQELTQTAGPVPDEVARWELRADDVGVAVPPAGALRALWWVLVTVFVAGTAAWAVLWPDRADRRLWRLGRRSVLQGLSLVVGAAAAAALAGAVAGGRSPAGLLAPVLLGPARTAGAALCVLGAACLAASGAVRLLRR